ncbi:MAG TPA: PA domain-containing protein [Falsiroseomonas sp.]|jgi:hypothetical protein|nr:PA domain-containing protein [Falsiroseomonas sp.]
MRKLAAAAAAVALGLFAGTAQAALVSTLQVVSPVPTLYPTGHAPMTGSATGDVTAGLYMVDLGLGSSGCDAADFAGFAAGRIALIERSGCNFSVKAMNAEAAGAVAAIIFNHLPGDFTGTLGGAIVNIPVIALDRDIGLILAENLPNGGGLSLVRLTVANDPSLDVPEPATLGLLGAALLAFAALRRRRHPPA